MLISAGKKPVLNLFQTHYRNLNAQKQKKRKFERKHVSYHFIQLVDHGSERNLC